MRVDSREADFPSEVALQTEPVGRDGKSREPVIAKDSSMEDPQTSPTTATVTPEGIGPEGTNRPTKPPYTPPLSGAVLWGVVLVSLISVLNQLDWSRASKLAAINFETPQSQHRHQSQAELVQSVPRLNQHADAPKPLETKPSNVELGAIELKSEEALKHLGIATAAAEQRAMNEYVEASGAIDYDKTLLVQLSSRVSGTVWRVEKKIGDRVQKGDVLSILQSNQVGTAKTEFLQSVVQMRHAEATLKRLQSLPDQVVAKRELFEAEANLREARIKQLNKQQALSNLGLPLQYDEKKNQPEPELMTSLQFLGLPSAIADKLDPKTTPANLIPVLAPFDGIVLQREIVVGEAVEPSLTQFVVADTSRMWILLNVRKEDADQLRIGQPLRFTGDSNPVAIEGKVNWISPEVDKKTRSIQVRAEVPSHLNDKEGGAQMLRANTFGRGMIQVRSEPQATVVPKNAVQWTESGAVVFVADATGRVFTPRSVEAGIRDKNWVEIRSGVKAGERVVTAGSHVLKSELAQRKMNNSGG
ncbi:MAG: efflux RND transporter periplasmic adaptor subunit [Planctomycetales bacterium]